MAKKISELTAAGTLDGTETLVLVQGGVTVKAVMNELVVDFGNLLNVPSVFPPAAHDHDASYAPLSHDHDASYAPLSHNHDAAQITAGVLDAARLPSNVALLDATSQTFTGINAFTKGWTGGGQGPIFVNSTSPIIELQHTAGGGTLPRHLIECSGPGLRIGAVPAGGGGYLYLMDMAVDGPIHECIFQDFDEFTIGSELIMLAGNTEIFGTVAIPTGLANFANDSAAASGGVPVGGLYRNGSVVQIRVT